MVKHALLEWRIRGTHKGVLRTSSGDIQPTGECVDFRGVSIWELDDDGLVVRERIYADDSSLLRQLQ